jgi:hypothetical protein
MEVTMKLKKLLLIPMIIILVSANCLNVSASSNLPYQAYNYDFWKDVYYTPSAYIPSKTYYGLDLGLETNFVTPQDLFVAADGKVYIADTGNNRIVVLNSDMTLAKEITGFDNQGAQDTFKSPYGIYVTDKNELYIADSENLRVVALGEDGSLLKIIQNPTSEVLGADFVFSPLKVSVDYADRVYVIAKNMFRGIMAFDENSNFTGFSGTINVNISAYEKLWRKLSTKAQRKRQVQFIPTEFTGIDLAPDGFLYATNIDPRWQQSIRRLNPKGQDVIKKKTNTPLSGDFYAPIGGEYAGPSRIIDIVYRGNGIYSVIDMVRGRIFTYDDEGDLLYIFGGRGTQEGTFKSPVAIEVKDDQILVLDANRGVIMCFSETEYGKLINQAVSMRYNGDEKSAVAVWEEVLKLDSNCELAYVGIGKSYLASGDNKAAMKYLKLGMDREYYSIAYKRYRDDFLKDNLGYVLTGGLILVIVIVIKNIIKKRTLRRVDEDE